VKHDGYSVPRSHKLTACVYPVFCCVRLTSWPVSMSSAATISEICHVPAVHVFCEACFFRFGNPCELNGEIEKVTHLKHFRSYYKMASQSVHSGPKSILFSIGTLDSKNGCHRAQVISDLQILEKIQLIQCFGDRCNSKI